jgi:hypothetical protein
LHFPFFFTATNPTAFFFSAFPLSSPTSSYSSHLHATPNSHTPRAPPIHCRLISTQNPLLFICLTAGGLLSTVFSNCYSRTNTDSSTIRQRRRQALTAAACTSFLPAFLPHDNAHDNSAVAIDFISGTYVANFDIIATVAIKSLDWRSHLILLLIPIFPPHSPPQPKPQQLLPIPVSFGFFLSRRRPSFSRPCVSLPTLFHSLHFSMRFGMFLSVGTSVGGMGFVFAVAFSYLPWHPYCSCNSPGYSMFWLTILLKRILNRFLTIWFDWKSIYKMVIWFEIFF